MSKQGKRKITVELPKSKDLSNRPSVFERLGTKKSSGKKTTEHCRQWAQHGTCAFGKSCKFAATHILISPSKQRAANKDNEQKKVKDDGKNRLHSTVVVRSGRSPDGEIDNWDQNDLEYADTDVLEKRRQQLQRELEIQLKMDSSKDMRKDKKKTVSSSSSSRSSSSSSVTSSSSDGSSSSSSSGREARRKGKKGKLKRNSSSSSEGDVPSKKKFVKSDSLKRDKSEVKKGNVKKDDKSLKKSDPKKKALAKSALGKKSLSPGKKSGGTPPITSKSIIKNASKHGKSPVRRDKKSVSPHSSKDRIKERDRDKEREKEREKEKERIRVRSRSPRKARSRSPRPHGSNAKDARSKGSIEPRSSRPISPKKQVRKDEKKKSVSRDRAHNKERSLERRKDKHDEKDARHDRKDRVADRGRDRTKDTKREDSKRRGRERGLGRGGADKGLEKPNKPMERLLPRPEERLAALAAISNRNLDTDKNSTNSKDRQDSHSERGGRKQDRERDRSSKRDRIDSMDRDPADYEMGMDRQYSHGRGGEHYERGDDRYDDGPGGEDRSPVYGMQGRDRHYEPGYEMAGPPRGYPEEEDRMYGYDERRRRDHSWEGRSGSMERERSYMHPHKEWDNEDYRAGGDWGRDRHWPMHDPQRGEWGDKEPEMEGWHHRGPGPHRGRPHGKNEYNRGVRMDSRTDNKRRPARAEAEPAAKETPPPAPAPAAPGKEPEPDDPVPDDLSEISDDPDDILNREDMAEHHADDDRKLATTAEESAPNVEAAENQPTQDTGAATEEKDTNESKDEEDAANMDFEEISDGELEEERTRAGLGDALGVDWASLVADVRRREQPAPSGGARDRWRPERVLARLGVSVHMAGEDTVKAILDKAEPSEDEAKIDVDGLHPVAAIQVATEKRKRQRAVLFGSGCEITRALSARRDLALRRHLCRLPAVERAPPARPAPLPQLFHAARALLLQG
ncbi:zinc finger CCCH domain-containing protein 13 isoform X1 [Plutella xylostella]|uniref:zinc finger CCCH domain-containing protein 13 isoform X1 n=1 Tax=Plutella xylostella TaxID=51655 RepID=UPI0020328441|nr:zinc finger CCCH domain-containing protein 13 isoform X1 [Plutella xylostella]